MDNAQATVIQLHRYELYQQVAELVGWKKIIRSQSGSALHGIRKDREQWRRRILDYTDVMDAAWELLEEMPLPQLMRLSDGWAVEFWDGGNLYTGFGVKAPVAICCAYCYWKTGIRHELKS